MTNFIEAYNPDWKTEFEKLKHLLHSEFVDYNLDIQHVGSTSIPDLCAKPILDIDIIVENKSLIGDISARLETIGYLSRGEQGIPGRFAFRQSSSLTPVTAEDKTWQAHHLYVCFSDSLALKNHLLFRDYLLQHKALVNEYAQLKMELTKEKGITKETYTKHKTEFIISVLTSVGLDEKELLEIKKANI